MQKHSIVALTVVIFSLALVTVALAADPHVGTWKLNVAKSKLPNPPGIKSSIVTVTAQDNGIKVVANGVNAEGKGTHTEYAAKYDGKDYPFTGLSADTITLKKIDANTFDEVLKKGGKEVSSGRNVVSKDGKTMTLIMKAKNPQGQDFNITAVYDKQ
jgi:hypothetical protein